MDQIITAEDILSAYISGRRRGFFLGVAVTVGVITFMNARENGKLRKQRGVY